MTSWVLLRANPAEEPWIQLWTEVVLSIDPYKPVVFADHRDVDRTAYRFAVSRHSFLERLKFYQALCQRCQIRYGQRSNHPRERSRVLTSNPVKPVIHGRSQFSVYQIVEVVDAFVGGKLL